MGYSGGTDSTALLNVLTDILKKGVVFNLVIIHVNYNLRGEDSLNDMEFAKQNAKRLNIPIYIKNIDLKEFQNKNVQIKAREIRYEYFEKLHKEKKFTHLLLAHNKNDFAETIIYKIVTGSSLRLKKSFAVKRGYILRPMLSVSRNEIEEYLNKKGIVYRLDVSNTKNKYARNRIRNTVIPRLLKVNKNALENIVNFSKKLSDTVDFIENLSEKYFRKIFVKEDGIDKMNINAFKKINRIIRKNILAKYISKHDVRITSAIMEECEKIIFSEKPNIDILIHEKIFVKEYDIFYIDALKKSNEINEIIVDKKGIYDFSGVKISVDVVFAKDVNLKSKNVYLDIDFPFIVRKRKEGDFMNVFPTGEKKSLRKIFIDAKSPKSVRDKTPVIEHSANVAALCLSFFSNSANRIDNSVRIKNDSEKVIEIKILNK